MNLSPQSRVPGPESRAGPRSFIAFVLLGMAVAFFVAVLLVNFILLPWHVRMGREVPVPDLIGRAREDAEQELKARGFLVGDVQFVADTLHPAGRVAEMKPKPGTRVKVGRVVSLEVSSGLEKTQVPAVYRLPLRRAQAAIDNAGLRLGRVDSIPSTRVPEGQVISTSPEVGLRVPKGTFVALTVSLGSEGIIEMPRLKGLSLTRAKDAILNLGLILADVAEKTGAESDSTVIAQTPSDGTEVTPGDSVKLTISRRKAATKPDTVSNPRSETRNPKSTSSKPATKPSPKSQAPSPKSSPPKKPRNTK